MVCHRWTSRLQDENEIYWHWHVELESKIQLLCYNIIMIYFLISDRSNPHVLYVGLVLGYLVYRTGISWYRSGNTKCWFGNVIYISGTDYICQILWSILPVPAHISSAPKRRKAKEPVLSADTYVPDPNLGGRIEQAMCDGRDRALSACTAKERQRP